jgi:hypothetical protein
VRALPLKEVERLLLEAEGGEGPLWIEVARVASNTSSSPVVVPIQVVREEEVERRVHCFVLPPQQGRGLGYLAIREFTDETLYEVPYSITFLSCLS